MEAGQEALETLTEQVPEDTAAQLQLAQVLTDRGRWRDSCLPLVRATKHLPTHAPLVLELIRLLLARGEVVAARRCLDFLAGAPDPPAALLVTQASLRFALIEIAQAGQLVERALQAGADGSRDHYLNALLLQFSGQWERASETLVRCLRRWPDHADAALLLSRMRADAHRDGLLAAADRQLAQPLAERAAPGEKYRRAVFENVRFQLLDAAGRPSEAWPSLVRCNALMRAINPYDAAATTNAIDALLRMAPPDAPDPAPEADDGPVPVFVVGLPRSGSTLLERMLSGHSQIASAGELGDFWFALHWGADVCCDGRRNVRSVFERSTAIDYRAVGARYLEQTRWRAGGAKYYIDKLPSNIELVPFIRCALPQAPIIHIWRPAMDVCFSNLAIMLGNVSAYSYGQCEVAQYYLQYRRLVDCWHERFPAAMRDVAYTDLVARPEATVRRLLAGLGLEFESACVHPEDNPAPANTISNVQVREPIQGRPHARWRPYARELQLLQASLAAGNVAVA